MMGQGVVRDLLSDMAIIDIQKLRVCDSARGRMEVLKAELNDPRIELVDLDVSVPSQLQNAIKGADICINSVPTLAGFQMQIFEQALNLRVPYLDLGGLGIYTVKQLEWRERFRNAGMTAVIGTGGDPGMSNVICRAVADELDEIDKINLYWAAEFVGPECPVLLPPYTVSTVLAEYAQPSTQFLDGKHVSCEPMSGVEVLDLPEPWGRCEFMYSPHSEQLTVPLADGIKEKGIQEFTWKLHLSHREHEAWVGLVKAGFGDFDDPVTVGGITVKPIEVLNAVISRNIERNKSRIPERDGHDIHFAVGRGRIKGKAATVRCEVIVKPDPLYAPYLDAATSMNVSIAAQLMLAKPMRPGVFAPEEYFEVANYLIELKKRKFEVNMRVEVE